MLGAMTVAGLLLAAGAGRRMGSPKGLLRDADGTPWVARSARVLADGGCAPVVVVVGARGDEVGALVPPFALVVPAADWDRGMSASLRAGLAALAEVAAPDVVAAVVGLVDTPGVTAPVVRLVAQQALAAGPSGLARATYDGVPGNPVALGRAHWAAVAASVQGDEGARRYLAGRDVATVECGAVGSGADVDEPPRGGVN
jgi:CTP:molybdopterin cytidylyltransferase MocA